MTASLLASTGPVADAFVADEQVISGIMGPYGSAKTTNCMKKILRSTVYWQRPGPDGVRRARWCVVRDTYQQLETNVLNSWFTWFPKTKDNWNGREMRHRLRYDVTMLDGSPAQPIELEMYFRAMGDRKAEEVLKGLELTGLWLNEADTLDKSVLRFGLPRCGRYPSAKDGGCAWYGVIADFNAPDIDNWTYELLVEKKLPVDDEAAATLREAIGPRFGIGFHRQPGGRSVEPPPENIENLPAGYYETMIVGMSTNDVRRFVDNEFGAVQSGQPVYPEYNDEIHCAKDVLKPLPDVPVGMGVDGGSTPAVVFGQRLDNGQIRWLQELVVFSSGDDEVLEKFDAMSFGKLAGEFWLEHFAKNDFGGAWGDPSAWYGPEDEYGWVALFWKGFREAVGRKAARWRFRPAPCNGNRLPDRLEAVKAPLRSLDGGRPGLLISKSCKMLRRGFISAYVIVRQQLSNGSGRYSDKPLKNQESHVHDAGQYLNLGLMRRGALAEDGEVRSRSTRERRGKPKVDFGGGPFAHREAVR